MGGIRLAAEAAPSAAGAHPAAEVLAAVEAALGAAAGLMAGRLGAPALLAGHAARVVSEGRGCLIIHRGRRCRRGL